MELDGVSGAVMRYGRKHAIPTPFHEIAYACLKPYKDGVR
jgi:2-dehydropantoate 2-reductase